MKRTCGPEQQPVKNGISRENNQEASPAATILYAFDPTKRVHYINKAKGVQGLNCWEMNGGLGLAVSKDPRNCCFSNWVPIGVRHCFQTISSYWALWRQIAFTNIAFLQVLDIKCRRIASVDWFAPMTYEWKNCVWDQRQIGHHLMMIKCLSTHVFCFLNWCHVASLIEARAVRSIPNFTLALLFALPIITSS